MGSIIGVNIYGLNLVFLSNLRTIKKWYTYHNIVADERGNSIK
jgi:hypothetical protein